MKKQSTSAKFHKILAEDKKRIYASILKKIEEGGLPTNWWDGRTSGVNSNNAKKPDTGKTNFEPTKSISGQTDLEEHHEEYPAEILGMTVSDLLDAFKEKNETMYHTFESLIDNFIKSDTPKAGELDESAMSTIDLLSKDARNFNDFAKRVFAEFKDLKKSKESVAWLKSIYDVNMNEVVIDENITMYLRNIAPDLIPGKYLNNKEFSSELTNAINRVYNKYNIGLTLKL